MTFVAPGSAIGTTAITIMRPAIEQMMQSEVVKRRHLYVMVALIAPDFGVGYMVMAHESFGDMRGWEHPYDEVARGKTRISARTGLSSREVQTMHPHLLEGDDVMYWGNAIDPPFIVSCSGVQPWYDEAISKATLALCRALTHDQVESRRTTAEGDFFDS